MNKITKFIKENTGCVVIWIFVILIVIFFSGKIREVNKRDRNIIKQLYIYKLAIQPYGEDKITH